MKIEAKYSAIVKTMLDAKRARMENLHRPEYDQLARLVGWIGR